jgi:hypothetical protein
MMTVLEELVVTHGSNGEIIMVMVKKEMVIAKIIR